MKKCPKCDIIKNVDDFHVRNIKRKHGKTTPQSYCKECVSLYNLRRYKITPEEYTNMLILQGNVCKICNEVNSTGARLVVDHCHTSGKIRSLLCNKCNVALGCVNEDRNILYSMISYIKEHHEI